MSNKTRKLVFSFIGGIEVLIGFTTFVGCVAVQHGLISGILPKPYNVFSFVLVAAAISFVLGVGLLCGREWARVLIVSFSGYVVVTKILIYSGLIFFAGTFLTTIAERLKDMASLFYHITLIFFLLSPLKEQRKNTSS